MQVETLELELGAIYAPIDKDIKPLVDAFRTHPGITTMGSCQGHPGHEHFSEAYLDLAVRFEAMERFVKALDEVESRLGVFIEARLIFQTEVATACDFENAPGWLMYGLSFDPNDKATLKCLAREFKQSLRS